MKEKYENSLTYFVEIIVELEFLLEESKKISFDVFCKNKLIFRAFLYSIEYIISKIENIPNEIIKDNPDIKWQNINDVIIKLKNFSNIKKHSVLWEIIKSIIPNLKGLIDRIIRKIARKAGEELIQQGDEFIINLINKLRNNDLDDYDIKKINNN